MRENDNSLPDPANDWFGFMAKISADAKSERIMNELEKLFPGEHCGNPECLKNCISAFEIGSNIGMELKSFIKNCIKEEIVPKWGCIPADEVPFDDYVREPLKKCDYGYYYGEHPDKTDKQIEGSLEGRQKAKSKQTNNAASKTAGVSSGGPSLKKQYDNILDKIRKNEEAMEDKNTKPQDIEKYKKENAELKEKAAAIETRVEKATHVIYSEMASLRPQKGADGKPDPKSQEELQKARIAVGEVSEKGEKTYKTQPEPKNSIEQKAWDDSKDAAWQMGNSTTEKEKHYYFYNPDRKNPVQPVNPKRTVKPDAKPTKVFGPFINTSPDSDSGKGNRIQVKIYEKE